MSRGTIAGAVFDWWTDIDGNGEVDIDEHGDTLNGAQLKAWMRDPPAEKPMYAPTRGMPKLDLREAQNDALVAYIETLESRDGHRRKHLGSNRPHLPSSHRDSPNGIMRASPAQERLEH